MKLGSALMRNSRFSLKYFMRIESFLY